MHRFPSTARIAATVVLLGLLLAACRAPEVPATVYPGTSAYPGPTPRIPTVVAQATAPIQQSTAPLPPASPVPTAANTAGQAAFTVTILHTGEVAGEVSPCG
jgi:hypothetical protein